MNINLDCIKCIINKADNQFDNYSKDPIEKLNFMKGIFSLVGSSPTDTTAPHLSKMVNDLFKEKFNIKDEYKELKTRYNKIMLDFESKVEGIIKDSHDPLLTAIRFAMIGNLIDFGALDTVETKQLTDLIGSYKSQKIDKNEYLRFQDDLSQGKILAYMLDNSGEIVFDKLCIKTIKNLYPNLDITAVVRGYPTLNDATYEDTVEVGLLDVVKVIDNGTSIPGTDLGQINTATKELINKADIIISKGQGNFESLHESKLNIYYIFLCKCDLFVKRFDVSQFTGLFLNEKRI